MEIAQHVRAARAAGGPCGRAAGHGTRWQPRVRDAAVAAGSFGCWLALVAHEGGVTPVDVVLLLVATAPLALWRRSPVGVLEIGWAAACVLAARGAVLWPPLGPAVALYLLTSSREDRAPWSARTAGLAVVPLGAYLGAVVHAAGWAPADLGHAVLGFAAAWFAGERTRLRRQQIVELHERAHRATETAARELRLAVAEERARIARDLHDSAGHALNVIAVRAGAARLRGDPGRSLTTIGDIEEIARQTVADIDQIVGMLRADDEGSADVAPPVGLASLDTLLAQHRRGGLRVALDRRGRVTMPGTAADQAAYRILQEALTNAARYGTGSVEVVVDGDGPWLCLTVTNPVTAGAPRPTGGHGIAGMRERATLLGGELGTESRAGLFRVTARLPLDGAAR